MNIKEILGNNIKYYREIRKMSQEELAYRANMGAAHLGNIERGHNNPTLTTLYKIARALEVDMEQLLEGNDASPRKQERSRMEPYNRFYKELSPRQKEVYLHLLQCICDMTEEK